MTEQEAIESRKDFPPEDCRCHWHHADDDRGWYRTYTNSSCPVHNKEDG